MSKFPTVANLPALVAKYQKQSGSVDLEQRVEQHKLCAYLDRYFSPQRHDTQPAWSAECAYILEKILPRESENFYRFLRENRILLTPHEVKAPTLHS